MSGDVLADAAAAVLLLAGVALALIASVGLVRLPDVLMRMHAQTKPAVLGLLLVLAGTSLAVRSAGFAATCLLVAAFQVLTAPVGAHLLGRTAHRDEHAGGAGGAGGAGRMARDDLRDHPPR